jgi:hypothetical protein
VVFPLSFYVSMVETEPFSAKLCLIFLYFWTLHYGLHPKTEWCKSNYFLHFHSLTFCGMLHWHFDYFIQSDATDFFFFCGEKAFNCTVTYYTEINVHIYDICQHNHISK